jgi:MFS transporter, NNP family, nitrate/nitrite transporter
MGGAFPLLLTPLRGHLRPNHPKNFQLSRDEVWHCRLRVMSLWMPQIRAFHMAWFASFLGFFAWFGIAPLMKVVRDELQLTQSQIGWSIIASVAITVLARLLIGWLCDRIGPRLTLYLAAGVGIAAADDGRLARDPWTFIFFRLLIGGQRLQSSL